MTSNTETVEKAFVEETGEQPQMPGHESAMADKPEWEPRYPGSGRLAGKVAIAYLEEDDDARTTADAIESEGSEALLHRGDLGDPEVGKALVDAVIGKWGRLDVLVNNAGEQHPDKDIRDITVEQLQRTFQSNIFSMFYLVQAARPHLKKGAAIVNCTSVTMYQGAKELLDYSATKGAITAFTRSLSENLIGDGIRVNAVAPGPIWTPLNPFGGASPEKMKTFGQDTPIGRPGQPNEVAPAFLFLACEDSSYMSGQVLHPNGGTIVNG
jgi:NAD(P)-dependent dehydrogenase (short-subunit alcohol dehydrogenase family)